MEAIKRQASKFREQVARQQQAVLRQLGHLNNGAAMTDDDELRCYEQLQNLYSSTRAAKHFQRDIVRGVEGFISTSKKQMEIAIKLAEDCCKYGNESQSDEYRLATAALQFGTSHKSMENERESLLGILGSQICEPLRESITSAPLEDARHLTRKYSRLRQEAEAQATEVIRRKSKCMDPSTSAESSMKLQSAEKKLNELRSALVALGREANAAMLSVEDQQQKITFQKLVTMVEAEKSFHKNIVATLDDLHAQLLLEKQLNESSWQSVNMQRDPNIHPMHDDPPSNGHNVQLPRHENQDDTYFIAKVIHSFDAQANGELSLSVDDYVVVRQVGPNGWSEGECMGKTGWFPSAYVERQDKAPKYKVVQEICAPQTP